MKWIRTATGSYVSGDYVLIPIGFRSRREGWAIHHHDVSVDSRNTLLAAKLQAARHEKEHDLMKNDLESAVINLFRAGNVVNISQATAQIIQAPSFRRGVGTVDVKRVVERLEKAGYLKREKDDGITRFSWAFEKQSITVDLDDASLIVSRCLPRNEHRMRGAEPELVAAITRFKAAVVAGNRKCAT